MKITSDRFLLAYAAVAVFTAGSLLGTYLQRTDAVTEEPINLMQARYNINCPLRFYLEEQDVLTVRSFSCTLDRKDIVAKSTPHK